MTTLPHNVATSHDTTRALARILADSERRPHVRLVHAALEHDATGEKTAHDYTEEHVARLSGLTRGQVRQALAELCNDGTVTRAVTIAAGRPARLYYLTYERR